VLDLIGGLGRGRVPTAQAMTVLYLTYDGLTDPLGQSQVLPYLEGLSRCGPSTRVIRHGSLADEALAQDSAPRALPAGLHYRFVVLSFEKPGVASDEAMAHIRERCRARGIVWHPLRYHKWPPAISTAYDVLRGVMTAWQLCRRHRPLWLHARSDIPAIIGLMLKRLTGIPLVFDMRGFWVGERIDGGIWRDGSWLVRAARRIERWLVDGADRIVVLTEAMAEELRCRGASAPISVIPTCVDTDLFRPEDAAVPAADRSAGNGSVVPDSGPTLVYAGSLGTVYMLDEVLRFSAEAFRHWGGGRLLLVSPQSDQSFVAEAIDRCGLGRQVVCVRAGYREVPRWLTRADAGIAFYKPGPSVIGRYPTKIGEYLACGIPAVVNRHVPDATQLVEEHRVGAAIDRFEPEAFRLAAERLRELWRDGEELRRRCRRVAEECLSVSVGVERYRQLYEGIELQAARRKLQVRAGAEHRLETAGAQSAVCDERYG